MVPQPTPVCHITHIENLPSILADGGLRCCADLRRMRVGYRNIAFGHIQDRRGRLHLPCGPGGPLHTYVPFYFAPRSPMLYTISRGNVPTYREGQEPIVYLVSTVQAIQASGHRFVFTDGHAATSFSQFYDDPVHLSAVDWPLMTARDWYDTPLYPDRMRRRQAELLVHRFLSWRLVLWIGVFSEAVRRDVRALLASHDDEPVVVVRRHWYY